MRLAIVGLGRGAVLTAPGILAHDAIELVAGCDPSGQARDAFIAATGALAVADYAALLADPAIDAVYVASPHEYHAEHAVAAARVGKHVLVEKPMAVALADAVAMRDAAATAGVVMMVGPSHGYDPPVALAAELARAAGGARLIHAANFTDFLRRPRRPAELDRAQGGGVVFSQASHQIDMVRVIANSPVESVRGWVGRSALRDTDGSYSALLTFANGAAASLTYSGEGRFDSAALAGGIGELGRPRAAAAAVAGDEAAAKAARGFAAGLAGPAPHQENFGQLLVSCGDVDLELTVDGVRVHEGEGEGAMLRAAPLPRAPRYNVVDAFVRAIRNGGAATFDADWGLKTLACCHAIIASAETGRDVRPADLIHACRSA